MAGPGNRGADCRTAPWSVYLQKKTEIKAGEETHWRNLFASLVKNTSLTMQDIENLRINQMEDLLVGLSENAEKEQAALNGESTNGVLEGDDAIRALLGE